MSTVRTAGGDEIPCDGGPIGLALSGGGLKAALFHIGVLARLAELDLLRRIDVVSGTSGGALIAALYHLRLKRALDADGDISTDRLVRIVAALERDVVKAVQTDLRAGLLENPISNLKRASAKHSDAMRLGKLLEQHLFRPVWNGDPGRPIMMRDLAIHPRGDSGFSQIADNRKRYCKAPALVINAANLASGRSWRFDSERMGEPVPKPADRRLSKTPLFDQSAYHRLPNAYADITLGQAIAASMAKPGLLEPLRLHQLYPSPKHASHFLDVHLADGRLSDALGTDALVERGCTRMIVSDGSGREALPFGSNDRLKALQLEAVEASRPGGLVLIHMLSDIEATEIKPLGSIGHGHIVTDRGGNSETSYGVERRLQRLIAGMRADLDAPSDIEAMALMADGYLIAKRAFHQQRLRGRVWTDDPPAGARTWQFSAMFEPLRQPPKKLVKHLAIARRKTLGLQRLTIDQALGFGLLALAAVLTLIALAAVWSSIRPQAGGDRVWVAATIGLLMLCAWLSGRHLGDRTSLHAKTGLSATAYGWVDQAWMIATALPLALGARFQRHTSRAFVKAGRLKAIGVKPIAPEKPAAGAAKRRQPPPRTERKAA